MTADVRNDSSMRRPETGWAEARRGRGSAIRTCVAARAERDGRQAQTGSDWNIVRGED
ncbi:hypothetical protein ACFYP4_16235 [Streptomyces sp. NPDC005551]|uniref:hypothetical protein n=1 Tax=Streptomyces sp. NPDC005551 TaxID=3364725 RepID=UPI0036D042CC